MYTNQRLQIVDIPTLVDEPPIFSRQVRNVLAVLLHDQSPPLAIGLYGPARDIIDTVFMTRYWLALDSVLAAVRLKLLMDARDIIPVSTTQTRPGQEARLRDALIPVHRAFELSLFQTHHHLSHRKVVVKNKLQNACDISIPTHDKKLPGIVHHFDQKKERVGIRIFLAV